MSHFIEAECLSESCISEWLNGRMRKYTLMFSFEAPELFSGDAESRGDVAACKKLLRPLVTKLDERLVDDGAMSPQRFAIG